MTVKLKTFIELAEPFAYEIRAYENTQELRAKDGTHQVMVSNTVAHLKRWHRDMNRAFERGVRVGLSMQLAPKDIEITQPHLEDSN